MTCYVLQKYYDLVLSLSKLLAIKQNYYNNNRWLGQAGPGIGRMSHRENNGDKGPNNAEREGTEEECLGCYQSKCKFSCMKTNIAV